MVLSNIESSVIDLEESTVEEVIGTNDHIVCQPPLTPIPQVMKIFNGNHHDYQQTQQKQQVQSTVPPQQQHIHQNQDVSALREQHKKQQSQQM